MPSKPGRAPVSTSFKKGNTAALGNDKTLRLSNWLDKALDKEVVTTVDEYGAAITKRQLMAEELIQAYLDAKEPMVKKALFETIADRTEGKPHQTQDITSDGEKLQGVVFIKPDKLEE